MHLTLRFLGDTTPAQRHTLHDQLTVVTAQHASFVLTVAQLGCSPNVRRPSVIWLGVDGDEAALHALQAETERHAGGRLRCESRAFSPISPWRVDRDLPTDFRARSAPSLTPA
ncbi:MAG: 2'-5' RNA ligase family protein [Caldilineaceae bacterium]